VYDPDPSYPSPDNCNNTSSVNTACNAVEVPLALCPLIEVPKLLAELTVLTINLEAVASVPCANIAVLATFEPDIPFVTKSEPVKLTMLLNLSNLKFPLPEVEPESLN
jgi:hypothetical protein